MFIRSLTWRLAALRRLVGPLEEGDQVGAIGEGSAFHQTYSYYAQGVGPETATLPSGWRQRLVRIENPNTGGCTGPCPEVHDLAISKYVAGREKDREFTRELARHGMTDRKTLLSRLGATKLDPRVAKPVKGRMPGTFRMLLVAHEGQPGRMIPIE